MFIWLVYYQLLIWSMNDFFFFIGCFVCVVSLIFWVIGSSEHRLASKYLQNKQENGGGAPIASPMPKSDQGI